MHSNQKEGTTSKSQLHFYLRDCERCFRLNRFYGRPNHILFVGDSRVRQLYHAIRGLNMDGSDPEVYVSSERVKGIPQLYDSPEQNLKLEYKVREIDLISGGEN